MLMVVAPSAPVAWWPGAAPLTGSLLRRLPARATAPAPRPITTLPVSGREVVALRVEGDPACPWGEPDGVSSVVIRTSIVPSHWLRPVAAPRVAATTNWWSEADVADVPSPVAAVATPSPMPRPQDRQPPQPTTAARLRRAAALAVGLLVSLVAVEAAARAGRR
jgi:hypothetical protein